MKIHFSIKLLTFFLSFFMIIFLTINIIPKPKLCAIKGEADFASFNINKTTVINGEWQVFSHQLIATDNVEIENLEAKYVNVPTTKQFNFNDYDYVSYRMILKNVPINQDIMIVLNNISEGYNLYVNRKIIYTNNKLRKGNEAIRFDTVNQPYHTESSELEIIIEISNYDTNFTGLVKPPHIVSYTVFQRHSLIDLAYKIFLIGSFSFAIFYQLLLISFRNSDRGTLYFTIACIFEALSLLTYKSHYFFTLENLFNISEKFLLYGHFLSIYISTGFIYLTYRSFFKKKKFTLFDLIITCILSFIIISPLLFSVRNFMGLLLVFNSLNLIVIILIFIWSIKYIKANPINLYLTTILGLIFCANTYDALIEMNIIANGEKQSYLIFLSTIIIFNEIIANKHDHELSNVQEVIELNKKIRDTEFTFLNTQIQSHFIYNTLNSIQALCNTNPHKASELIEDFSMYLRTRLEFNKMPILIDIEDELENIRTYLNIEKARFGNRVNYQYNLKVGDFKIPPLTVQPLVENAVKHGISKKKGGGTVTISTFSDDDFIYIVVEDNGLGFDPELLSEKQRVGTVNISHRLSLHLNATLTIESKINVGTKSTIKIPLDWNNYVK